MEEIKKMNRWSEAWLVTKVILFAAGLFFVAKVISHKCNLL